MNPYLAKILNENGKYQVQALLNCNIITPNELKDEVISSNDGSCIYYGALAIYHADLKNPKPILDELKQALFTLNDYLYILYFMKNIKLYCVECLNKLINANDAEVLIETLKCMTYIGDEYLNNEKRKFFVETLIKKLISLKAYEPLFEYLNGQSEYIRYMTIYMGDKDFLKAYQEYLFNTCKNWSNQESFNKYKCLITERITELSLEDKSLTPDEALDYFQRLVRTGDLSTVKKYASIFRDLFIGDQAKLTK